MVTDRDIAIRAVAEGKNGDTPVGDNMTAGLQYCFHDDDLDAAARKTSDPQVRRLPVLNRDKRLLGVISVSDIPRSGQGQADAAKNGIAQKSGHRQQ